jgi:hypothetical protein
MTYGGQSTPEVGGGPGKRARKKPLWYIDEKIRERLREGINLKGVRLGVIVAPDVAWIKVDEKTKHIKAVYVKGPVKVVVSAGLRNDGDVDVFTAALECVCHDKGSLIEWP